MGLSLLLFSLLAANCKAQAVLLQDVQQPLQSATDAQYTVPGTVHGFFESPEHQFLGDSLNIPYGKGNVSGAKFDYEILGNRVSFGQLVTLSDFYANWDYVGCPPQLSDPGLTDQQRMDQFKTIIGWLLVKPDWTYPPHLKCILDTITDQAASVHNAADPAQKYESGSGGLLGFNAQYGVCDVGYLKISVCNWDHFGQDAITSYQVGHRLALNQAWYAKDETDLKKAYLYESFAQHFLSDLFSTGHLRVPRRLLHDYEWRLTAGYPADQCAQLMHGEDSATGLWVTNALGESWPAYGDKQLAASKSYMNRDKAAEAMQMSVDEVFAAFKGGKWVDPVDYVALKKTPSLASVKQNQNYVPLFSTKGGEKFPLYIRSDVDNRGNSKVSTYDVAPTWSTLESSTASKGAIRNKFVRTMQDFLAEANVTHIRQVNGTHLVINQYGPTWTRLWENLKGQTSQRSWNMISQAVGAVGIPGLTWNWAQRAVGKVYLLAGKTTAETMYYALEDDGHGKIKKLWEKSIKNVPCPDAQYVYGQLSSGTEDPALVTICSGTNPTISVQGLSSLSQPPVQKGSWTSQSTFPASTFLIPSAAKDTNVLVQAAYSPKTTSINWYFSQWSSAYESFSASRFTESKVSATPLAYLRTPKTLQGGANFVRVSMINSISRVEISTLKVEVGQVSAVVNQTFSWPAPLKCETIEWFLEDLHLEDSSTPDVIAYCSSRDTIVTAVFASQTSKEGTTFSAPVFTEIKHDYAELFNSAFLKHITTKNTFVYDKETQKRVGNKVGLLEFFDNYGVLGARLLVPKADADAKYKPIGQVPAIAGQLSAALGPNGLGIIFD